MRISSYSEFRRNPAAAIDRVNADREPPFSGIGKPDRSADSYPADGLGG